MSSVATSLPSVITNLKGYVLVKQEEWKKLKLIARKEEEESEELTPSAKKELQKRLKESVEGKVKKYSLEELSAELGFKFSEL